MMPILTAERRTYDDAPLRHRHPHLQLVFPERGALQMEIEGERSAVRADIFAVVAPGQLHVSAAQVPTDCLVVDLETGQTAEGPAFRPFSSTFARLRDLLAVEQAAGGLNEPLVAESLAAYIRHSLAKPSAVGSPSSAIGRKAHQFIDERITEPFSIDEIATLVGASVSTVQRGFRIETGRSIMSYAIERRLELARTFLASPQLTITEIAHRVGFADSAYFSRVFSRASGMTPSSYRAAYLTGSSKVSPRL